MAHAVIVHGLVPDSLTPSYYQIECSNSLSKVNSEFRVTWNICVYFLYHNCIEECDIRMIFECRHCFATIDTEELDYDVRDCPSCDGFLNK